MTNLITSRGELRPAFTRCLVVAVFLNGICLLHGQNFFCDLEENLLYYSPEIAPTAVCVADLGSDGDQDILSFFEGKFRLYEHTDGAGTFVEHEIISAAEDWMLSVSLTDLNGDGSQDIVAASYNNDRIVWYAHEGDLLYGAQKTIAEGVKGAISLEVEDLDLDGDQDVLSASLWDNTIAWYENDGSGMFGSKQVLSDSCDGARYVTVSDINSDGLPDVLSASIYDNHIMWYKNEGAGIFGSPRRITGQVARPICIYTADMDGDGDQDVLSASSWDNKIAWYENDGQGSFGPQQVISTSLMDAQSVSAADLDNDGDQDVLSASVLDNKIAWYPNQGSGDFGAQQVVTVAGDMPGFVHANDVDGDGYMDIISASTDFKIAWYQNTLPLQMVSNPADTAVYPGKNAKFSVAAASASGYRWQYSTGDGYIDVSDSEIYNGASTDKLEITGVSFDFHGNLYRCVAINGPDSLYSASALLAVIDTVLPVITSEHPAITLQADEACLTVLPDFTRMVTASDNSGDTVYIEQDPLPYSWISGAGMVILTATDPSGNSSQVSFPVIAEDLTGPICQLHEFPELDTNLNGQFVLPDYSELVEATDNCSDRSAISITQDPPPGYLIPDTVYVIDVTLTVTDEAGNTTPAKFSVATMDVVPPVITSVHPDTTIEGNFDCVAYVPDFTGTVAATDNSGETSELSIMQTPEPYTVVSGNDNIITLIVVDQSGNAAEATFNLDVASAPPTIDCIGDQVIDLVEGQSSYTVSGIEFDPEAVTFDCGFGSMINNINGSNTLDLEEFNGDTTLVTWTLTDGVGNIAECSFNVVLNQWVGMISAPVEGITVYPNPTTGELHFECTYPVQKLQICDLRGKTILERTDMHSIGTIDLSGVRTGTFILSLCTRDRIFKQLIVKE